MILTKIVEKPKESQCFFKKILKNLRKTIAFMNKSLRGLRKPLEFHKKAKENIRKTNDKKQIDEKTLLNKKINKIYLMVAPPKKT